jgi:hypothetical protein
MSPFVGTDFVFLHFVFLMGFCRTRNITASQCMISANVMGDYIFLILYSQKLALHFSLGNIPKRDIRESQGGGLVLFWEAFAKGAFPSAVRP